MRAPPFEAPAGGGVRGCAAASRGRGKPLPYNTICAGAAAALLALLLAAPIQAQDDVSYTVELTLDAENATLTGTAALTLTNTSDAPLSSVPLVLYPNRFREIDPAIDDFNFDRFYVPWFTHGHLDLTRVTNAEGQELTLTTPESPDLHAEIPRHVLTLVTLSAPLAPGETLQLDLAFSGEVPERLGTYGHRDERFVLEAGFVPYVPHDADLFAPPVPATWDVSVRVTGDIDRDDGWNVLIGGQAASEEQGTYRRTLSGSPPSLAVGEDMLQLRHLSAIGSVPSFTVYGEEGDEDRADRIIRVAQDATQFLATYYLPDHADNGALAFIQAPLRDRFVHAPPSEGVIFYSNRLFHLFVLLQRFHELEVARGVFVARVRQHLAAVDLGADRDWVCEAIGWLITIDWVQGRGGVNGRQVREGLGFLSFIPAIDRLLNAPRFPGSDLFYGRFYEAADS
ncbi:hypothetical protein OAX78_02745, partial [Planctomycetota bacterium]|nr:hypothetical protein [Planctomycetota bacterium]